MKLNIQKPTDFWKKPEHYWIRNAVLFLLLLFGFHYIYIFWTRVNFYPVHEQVLQLFDWSSQIVFNQSAWVLEHILQIEITTSGQTIWLQDANNNHVYVGVDPGCTTLKQWMHWLFLMILFPGPWKHKLWYIPLGLVVIHFINDFRIIGLALTLIPYPEHFHFFHSYIFKTFFYFMIFLMWLIWVEFFYIAWRDKAKP